MRTRTICITWLTYEFCYKARAITPTTTIAQIIDILVVLLDKFNFTVDYWVCYHFLPFFICGGVDLIAVINCLSSFVLQSRL